VRHPNPTREHFDSAWTVSLLLGFGLGGIIWILTPLTTAYFHEPRATLIVEILAFRTMLSGAQNIGVVNFQRKLQFNKQFWFNVIPTLVSFPLTIASAFILRNYWALVIGLMAEYVTTFSLSYILEPFRPRIGFSKVREIWSFSFWSLVKNIGVYLNMLVDRVAIGGFAGSAAMGRYQVAAEVATTPSQEIVNPMVSVLFPVLASVQHDREKRVKLYLTVLYWSALICTSTAVGGGAGHR
jgi:O-antigen/teichoic acid export membrane protein